MNSSQPTIDLTSPVSPEISYFADLIKSSGPEEYTWPCTPTRSGFLEETLVFGHSSQRNKRLRTTSPSSALSSPSSTGAESFSDFEPLPLTPSPPTRYTHSRSAPPAPFVLQPAPRRAAAPVSGSVQIPGKPDGELLGLGISNVFADTPILKFKKSFTSNFKSKAGSRMFKVGRGNKAVVFEPVESEPLPPLPASFRKVSVAAELEQDSDSGNESEDEFVSYSKEFNEPRPAVVGPSTIEELGQLRKSAEMMYAQATQGRGPASTSPQMNGKKTHRKAVPSITFSEHAYVTPSASRLFASPSNAVAHPVVLLPGSEFTNPEPFTLRATGPQIPTRSASMLDPLEMPLPISGILRHDKPNSLTTSHIRYSSAGSSSTASSASSVHSNISTPASSEAGSMPVTPHTSHIRECDSFFVSKEKTFELDVASVFFAASPEDDFIPLPSTQGNAQKSFYQNQQATKSTLKLLAAKFKMGSNKGEKQNRWRL